MPVYPRDCRADGSRPRGWEPSSSRTQARSARDLTLRDALGSWQWYALWVILFLIIAGLMLVNAVSPFCVRLLGERASSFEPPFPSGALGRKA